MRGSLSKIIVAASGLFGTYDIAQAVVVTNVTTNTRLFASDFESDTVSQAPSITSGLNTFWRNAVPDHVPVITGQSSLATFGTLGPTSGAFQGSKYLQVYRDGFGAGTSGAEFVEPAIGDTIHMEWKMYIPDGADLVVRLDGGEPTGTPVSARAAFRMTASSAAGKVAGIQGYDPGTTATDGAYTPSNKTFQINTWETWKVDYVIGNSTLDVTVGANTATIFAIEGPFTVAAVRGGGTLNDIHFTNAGPTKAFYVDAVDALGLPGDANLDGRVNALDFNTLATHYGMLSGATLSDGDFNADQMVDSLDFVLLSANFNQSTSPSAALSAVVPEPSAAMLLLLPVLLRRRARRPGR